MMKYNPAFTRAIYDMEVDQAAKTSGVVAQDNEHWAVNTGKKLGYERADVLYHIEMRRKELVKSVGEIRFLK